MKKLSIFDFSIRDMYRDKLWSIGNTILFAVWAVVFIFLILFLRREYGDAGIVLQFSFCFFVLLQIISEIIIFGSHIKNKNVELGLLKSFGAKRSDIFKITILEIEILILFGSILGFLIFAILYLVFDYQFGNIFRIRIYWLDFLKITFYFLIYLVYITLVSFLAILIPTIRSSFVDVYTVFRRQ